MNDSPDPRSTQPMSALLGDLSAAPIYTVQLLGFTPKERTLFTSVFKLSSSRAMRYVEFDPATHPHADFYVVDAQDPSALEAFVVIDTDSYGGALMVGQAPNCDEPAITRPIRWAEVLMRLDELPRPAHPAQVAALIAAGYVLAAEVPSAGAAPVQPPTPVPVPSPQPPVVARAENELEISQLDNWYDREKVVTFQTDAAVLVVEPDIAARRYMAAKFIDLKYRVDFAESGEQAMELIRTHRYNAIFLETALPGVDGFEVCRAVKGRPDRRRIAVIFVTHRNSTVERVKGAMAGCDAYLTKPIDQEKLVSTLDKFLPNWRLQLPLV
ncbi:MAG TPA: response regulator [Burkholderiaceae bacterium]|nr:response regulator [Burkholderiaceae bacterium]